MKSSVGWWCKSKHAPERLVTKTQQWVKEHSGDWKKKTFADLHRMGMRSEVYQPLYQQVVGGAMIKYSKGGYGNGKHDSD